MVSKIRATDTPRSRVEALHILRLHDDDIDELSTKQIAALRRLYFLDDDRRIDEQPEGVE
jgi:hypothetical protein